ncbi:MAG: heme lyase CcmF/NrfE family subunit, partial [Gammaproteobacteria bacterium]|nr:heme lyase CcmF/NrfE family subunit [Gammaproteobacteria bacterium]
PLLQDPGLVMHPPLLYMGYVGLSVPFAFSVAALMTGSLSSAWARWTRPWTVGAWMFLTVGIALGSWWAYYELGWGGWWFWDPVENASFMPWLAATALIHSLAVAEKRGAFKTWTLLLALMAFSLSLLGAFIVRSGVLTSVHAFAVDPTRGLYILGFLVVVVGGSLTLFALRASAAAAEVRYGLFSREASLLVNNLLLVVAMAVVLLGTLYPLAYEAVTGGDKISIGPPWFNRFFVPLMLAAAVALGVGPFLSWKRSGLNRLRRRLTWCFSASLGLAALAALLLEGFRSWGAAAAVALGLWIVCTHAVDAGRRLPWPLPRRLPWPLPRRLRIKTASVPLAYWGMALAHIGFAVSLLGIALTHELSVEKDIRMSVGESATHGDVTFRFDGVVDAPGPNYRAQRGLFAIEDGERRFGLTPEKRRYFASGSVMTEAAIDAGFFKDIYVSLGEPLADGDWAVRVYVKPFVRWIWLGAILMALGGSRAGADKRYRRRRRHIESRRAAVGVPA